MGRKKDNQFIVGRATEALNAAFAHGMAQQRLMDARAAADHTGHHLEQAVGALNEVIVIPPKKELN